jgi:Tfp pilus assembly protein PilV
MAALRKEVRPCVWGAIQALKIRARAAITRGMTTPWGSGGAVGRAALADERGWALVETLVSAVLLIVISLAITSSLDTASRASAENKQRSIAATLAEQDQERMRAMDPTALSNYHPAARTVTTPDGGTYTITSRSDWIRDSTGAPESCTTNTSQADYLRITSTVTSRSVGTDTQPVVSRGIVTPAVGTFGAGLGTFAVKVVDRNSNPVPNMLVTTSGTKVYSDYTNSLGCAVFGYIPIGPYNGIASNAGSSPPWVDPDNATTAQNSGTVNQGQVTTVQVMYDQSGSLAVTLDGTPPQVQTAGTKLQINQPAAPSTKTLTATVSPGSSTTTVTNLFPWPASKYNVYAGSCTDADPSAAAYGATVPATLVAPAATPGLTVHLPVMQITVKKNGGALGTAANVRITSTVGGCSDTFYGQTTSGSLSVPMPYGHYTVCADWGGRKVTSAPLVNKGAGITVPTINIVTTIPASPLGTC